MQKEEQKEGRKMFFREKGNFLKPKDISLACSKEVVRKLSFRILFLKISLHRSLN
jgi:hypothetical protein